MGRRSLAIALVCLLVGVPLPGTSVPLGIVTQSLKGHLSTADASAGATIYDGDRLSTDAGGLLRLRSGASSLYLTAQTGVTLRGTGSGALAELTSGSLVFSSAQASSIEVLAREARIRAADDVATIAQISVLGSKELRITARRGVLKVSYRDETERIPEGASYRVLLDPSPADIPVASNGRGPSSWPAKPAKYAGNTGKGLLLIGTGAVAAVTVWAIHEAWESPDSP